MAAVPNLWSFSKAFLALVDDGLASPRICVISRSALIALMKFIIERTCGRASTLPSWAGYRP